jgi:hypothetical protein
VLAAKLHVFLYAWYQCPYAHSITERSSSSWPTVTRKKDEEEEEKKKKKKRKKKKSLEAPLFCVGKSRPCNTD